MIFILLILLAAPAFAQAPPRKAGPARKPPARKVEPPQAPAAWPLVSLVVKGNKIYTEQQVLRASGLKLGQPADNAAFEAARERLMKTGAFESVGYQFGPDASEKGYSGTLAVQEVEQLFPFRFEDLPATDAEIRAFLRQREPLFEKRMPGTRQYLDRTAAAIQEFVASRGFKDTVVARTVPDGPGELEILFRPSAPRPAIGEVRFTGNQVLPASTLHNTFGLVAVGVPYTEKRVRELLHTSIRPLYEEKGHLEIAFPKIESAKMEKVDGLRVTIGVVEGPVYKVGKVKFAGSAISPQELTVAAKFKEGEVANFTEAQAAAERVANVLRKQGYLKSVTTVERAVNEKDKVVDVTFRTVDGRRYEMGKLTIEGLDVTTEPAIRKLWSMTPGKPFNADYPQYFLNRVREDGYLDDLGKTRFEQVLNDATGTVDVTLFFSGTPVERKKPRQPGF